MVVFALLAITMMLAAFAGGARADSAGYTVTAESEFGPQLSDIARTRIVVSSLIPEAAHFSCDSTVSQTGNQIVITVIAFPGSMVAKGWVSEGVTMCVMP